LAGAPADVASPSANSADAFAKAASASARSENAIARSSGALADAASTSAMSSFPYLQLNIMPTETYLAPIDDGRASAHFARTLQDGKIRFSPARRINLPSGEGSAGPGQPVPFSRHSGDK